MMSATAGIANKKPESDPGEVPSVTGWGSSGSVASPGDSGSSGSSAAFLGKSLNASYEWFPFSSSSFRSNTATSSKFCLL